MEATFLKSALQEDHYPPPDRPEVAFAGRSNVGKSSLINTLLNRRKLVRTSATPGRTQAINFFSVDERLYFVDLPGYGYARVPPQMKKAWGAMVRTYLRKRPNLEAVVVILDIRRDPSAGDKDLLHWLKRYGIETILVLTKADKLSRNQVASRAKKLGGALAELAGGGAATTFSAKTRQGRKEVWERIQGLLIEIENPPGHRP
jgi:GTP-binding protein